MDHAKNKKPGKQRKKGKREVLTGDRLSFVNREQWPAKAAEPHEPLYRLLLIAHELGPELDASLEGLGRLQAGPILGDIPFSVLLLRVILEFGACLADFGET
jgi:hypothetical protein